MPSYQPIVEMGDPAVEIADLSDHRGHHFLEKIGDPRLVNFRERDFDTYHVPCFFRSNEAELSQIVAQSLNQLGALPYKKITRPMQNQGALLLNTLDCDEAHRRPAASQIASAWALSVLFRLMTGFTY